MDKFPNITAIRIAKSFANRYRNLKLSTFEDNYQECMLEMWIAHNRFDPSKGTAYGTWLWYYAQKACTELYRYEINDKRKAYTVDIEDQYALTTGEDLELDLQRIQQYKEFCENISPRDLDIINMRLYGNHLNEIAAKYNMSSEGIRFIIKRALNESNIC